ncbi:hypothetical protein M2440_005155 [Methylorubrum extorquens]|nr:hypothetical protein [Methylorubrum extorquens]
MGPPCGGADATSRVVACFPASRPRYPGLSRFERRSPADVRYAHRRLGPTRAGAAPIAWWLSISRSEPRRALTLDRTDMLGAGLRAPRHRCVRPTPFSADPGAPDDRFRTALPDRAGAPPRALQRQGRRAALAAGLGRGQAVRDEERRSPPEILRAGDVPLPVGAHPYRPRAQLRDGRRGGPLQACQGPQRVAPDGLGRLRPAGRERCHGAQGQPAGVDLRQHRHHARAAPEHGPVAGLEPGDRDLRSRLLQASAAHVPRLPGQGARHPPHGEGELGSGRSYRACQRAGDRRARLALGRARRAARADPVVHSRSPISRRICTTPSTAWSVGRRRSG